MKEVKDYNPSKDQRLINCKTGCGNERCFAKRYGLFAEKTCTNFVEPKLITNADRIRAMTDEEMAEFINDVWDRLLFGNDLPGMCDVCYTDTIQNCKKCWLDWLKQEASK